VLGVGVIATGCLLASACGSSNKASTGAAGTTTPPVTTAPATPASTGAAGTTTTPLTTAPATPASTGVAAPSTAATATTPSAPAQPALTQTYLAIVQPANDALATFETKANAWTGSTTNRQATNDAAPFIAAVRQAANRLQRVQWPASTRADVNELVGDFSALTGDLAALGTLDMRSASSWVNRFTGDVATAGVAAATVRTDLTSTG
jgi:hypothetical protein